MATDTRQAIQSAASNKSVIKILLEKGNLKVGDPLACVLKGDPTNGLLKKEEEDGKSVFIVGITTKDKIFCSCGCLEVYTMSEFEIHAGSNKKRGSSVIFLMDGSLKSLKDLLDEPVEGETGGEAGSSSLSSSSCDICMLTGGEVICCATPSCQTTFHSRCLRFQIRPNGQWYCRKCTCRICHISLRLSDTKSFINCILCGDEYHTDCCSRWSAWPHLHENGEWFCSDFCEQAFELLEARVKVSLNENFTHTLRETFSLVRSTESDLIFEEEESARKQEELEQKAAEVGKLFHAFLLLKRNFQDQNVGMNRVNRPSYFENILYPVNPRYKRGLILRSKYRRGHTRDFRCLDQYGFYTVLLEIKGEIMAVATIRIHSKQVAEIPFITTCEAHRGKGFCGKLMKFLETMLKSFGVQTLVVQSPPNFVAMWASKFSLHPADPSTKRQRVEKRSQRLCLHWSLEKKYKVDDLGPRNQYRCGEHHLFFREWSIRNRPALNILGFHNCIDGEEHWQCMDTGRDHGLGDKLG